MLYYIVSMRQDVTRANNPVAIRNRLKSFCIDLP